MSEEKKLPALKDLYKGDVKLVKENDLNILLNQEPKKSWIRSHPLHTGVKYIPIEVVEYLLTSIFIVWRVEIRNIQVIANSVVVTVRLHYRNPIDEEMRWQDGVGACPIQTHKDAEATDFTQIRSDAIMKAAPAAKSYAVKDAAEELGKLFGKDLNRKDAFGYTALGNKFDMATPEQINYIDSIKGLTTYTDEMIAELDYEVSEGITSDRAAKIIQNLEMNLNKEIDANKLKDIQDKLNYKLDLDDT